MTTLNSTVNPMVASTSRWPVMNDPSSAPNSSSDKPALKVQDAPDSQGTAGLDTRCLAQPGVGFGPELGQADGRRVVEQQNDQDRLSQTMDH